MKVQDITDEEMDALTQHYLMETKIAKEEAVQGKAQSESEKTLDERKTEALEAQVKALDRIESHLKLIKDTYEIIIYAGVIILPIVFLIWLFK